MGIGYPFKVNNPWMYPLSTNKIPNAKYTAVTVSNIKYCISGKNKEEIQLKLEKMFRELELKNGYVENRVKKYSFEVDKFGNKVKRIYEGEFFLYNWRDDSVTKNIEDLKARIEEIDYELEKLKELQDSKNVKKEKEER